MLQIGDAVRSRSDLRRQHRVGRVTQVFEGRGGAEEEYAVGWLDGKETTEPRSAICAVLYSHTSQSPGRIGEPFKRGRKYHVIHHGIEYEVVFLTAAFDFVDKAGRRHRPCCHCGLDKLGISHRKRDHDKIHLLVRTSHLCTVCGEMILNCLADMTPDERWSVFHEQHPKHNRECGTIDKNGGAHAPSYELIGTRIDGTQVIVRHKRRRKT